MATVHIAIGNSDDKLSQHRWSQYIRELITLVRGIADATHGVWFSAPDAMFQNCCVAIEVPSVMLDDLRLSLTKLRKDFDQDSIAVNVSDTEFV